MLHYGDSAPQMNDHSVELTSCLMRLQAGDESARGELLTRSRARLERLARQMLRDFGRVRRWEDTLDIYQQAAMRLDQALKSVALETPTDYYRLAACQIRRVLIDLARHYYGPEGPGAFHRSAALAPNSETCRPDDNEPMDESRDGGQLALWTDFHAMVERLPTAQRDVFDLLWYQGLTQEAAAELLGVSDRTVRQRWREARLAISAALKGELPF